MNRLDVEVKRPNVKFMSFMIVKKTQAYTLDGSLSSCMIAYLVLPCVSIFLESSQCTMITSVVYSRHDYCNYM